MLTVWDLAAKQLKNRANIYLKSTFEFTLIHIIEQKV